MGRVEVSFKLLWPNGEVFGHTASLRASCGPQSHSCEAARAQPSPPLDHVLLSVPWSGAQSVKYWQLQRT